MRDALILVGIGCIVVIVGAAFAFSRSSSNLPRPTTIISSSAPMTNTMTLTSSAFQDGASIPSKFTCDGDQVNPPLSIGGVPEGAKSLVLIMDDPDVPKAVRPDGMFDHWVLFNIQPQTHEIAMGVTVGTPGANGRGQNQYTGPCPPPQYEPSEHRYFFKLYALDSELPLKEGASKADVEKAMQGHVIAQAQLMGKYKKK